MTYQNSQNNKSEYSHVRLSYTEIAILFRLCRVGPNSITENNILSFNIGHEGNTKLFVSFLDKLKRQELLQGDFNAGIYQSENGNYEIRMSIPQFQELLDCFEMFKSDHTEKSKRNPTASQLAQTKIFYQKMESQEAEKWRNGFMASLKRDREKDAWKRNGRGQY